ncbi:hypothetical protein [Porphyromonas pasteri]|jgi:hypothetical protein|uniref:Co-chaperone DjlA N-terminal domain-containing protein n=1 Tax=Porphyromonas pasteri TaxID=1583331 RepID=A0ABQ2H5L2_9PORP|nr:hypothetical protein [Porphyromonas pasteri]MBF1309859.1 hypothetical protein [Porphyromonadaceae bacterium]MBF1314048.1 hypothetical protein [Porphyromonadaceae bacterium]MBF1368734.1 hypothetical protein [Porphyromonadaceae bacterium]GGM45203.1 hypothetical protein GCM10007088_00090 [Porphyromonas pasteri]
MKTDIKVTARLMASILVAGGEYGEQEQAIVLEVAEALQYNEDDFFSAVEAALDEVEELDEDKLNTTIKEQAALVADEEIGLVFESALELSLADRVLTISEAEMLHAIAEALGISAPMATLLIADMLKEEDDIEIDLGE